VLYNTCCTLKGLGPRADAVAEGFIGSTVDGGKRRYTIRHTNARHAARGKRTGIGSYGGISRRTAGARVAGRSGWRCSAGATASKAFGRACSAAYRAGLAHRYIIARDAACSSTTRVRGAIRTGSLTSDPWRTGSPHRRPEGSGRRYRARGRRRCDSSQYPKIRAAISATTAQLMSPSTADKAITRSLKYRPSEI